MSCHVCLSPFLSHPKGQGGGRLGSQTRGRPLFFKTRLPASLSSGRSLAPANTANL